MNARQAGHGDADIVAFYRDLEQRFRAIPGVRGVSASNRPLLLAGFGQAIHMPGQPPNPNTRLLTVAPGFFSTLQIPIVRGRDLDERDNTTAPETAVISEKFARDYFGDEDPIGRRLIMDGRYTREMEIVGVAREAHYGPLRREVPPVVYIPYNQGTPKMVDVMTFVLRTAGDPLPYTSTVREIVRQADARVPITNIQTQNAQIDRAMNQEILFARLCSGFAILALVIACVGLYGTMSYNVARRTGEIGIRMALGARASNVAWMVLREVLWMSLAGLAIGLPVAFATSKLVSSFLFGIKPNDPASLGLAVATLIAAAAIAGYVPARRATRIDPMTALRNE
jgi:predicted permease